MSEKMQNLSQYMRWRTVPRPLFTAARPRPASALRSTEVPGRSPGLGQLTFNFSTCSIFPDLLVAQFEFPSSKDVTDNFRASGTSQKLIS